MKNNPESLKDILINSLRSNLPSIIAYIFSVVIGSVIAMQSSRDSFNYQFEIQNNQQAINIASAFKGEITALKKIVEQRKYEEKLKKIINDYEKTGKLDIFSKQVTKSMYFKVYENNISNIGMLEEPLPELITTFYTFSFSVVESISYLYKIDEDIKNIKEISDKKKKEIMRSQKDLLDKIEYGRGYAVKVLCKMDEIYNLKTSNIKCK